ncbi:unc-104 [Symbiodinium natans]|uniref:Unc-104 protein n=1 Tax=Symbiodinium natans TaxID=878477 RepID=A0A812HYX1_9DINO|nr:unc-104 [Symbiodinium natans]
MINQSLSNLALVISRLAEFAKSSDKNKDKKAIEHVPFRSSKLTFLLEDSLRGNSKTVMIAALSPAEFNYDETLSTLLFAQSVKAVKTNARKNVNLEESLVQELEAECERLRQLVNSDAGNNQLQELAALEEMQRKYGRDFQEQLKLAEDLQKQRELLLADAGLTSLELTASVGLDDRTPHLLNICYDPELNGCLIYFLQKGVTCSLGAGPGTLIALKGLGMQPKMIEMRNEDNRKVMLTYIAGRVLLNGRQQHPGEARLYHNDRLIVGHAFCFRLVIPSDSYQPEDVPLETALEEVEMPDDPAYQQCLMYAKNLQSRIGDVRAQQFRKSFQKVCRLVNEANEMAQALCPKERLLFGAEVLTDCFGTDAETVESIVRVRKLETGKARWRDVVKSKVLDKKEAPWSLLDTFVTVSMQKKVGTSSHTILLLNVDEFNQRLQHFRDLYKAVVTDHHSLEDMPLAERECWGRLPPWMAAELDHELEQEEKLEQEIAKRKPIAQGHEKSENEAFLEEKLACMQQLLDVKDRRIQSLELAAEAQGSSYRKSGGRLNERRHSTPSLGVQKRPEAPTTRRQAHRQLMSQVQELIRSGQERHEAKNKMLERHFQELESCGSGYLDRLKTLRAEVSSEVESRQNAEMQAQVLEEELRLCRAELEGSRSALRAEFSASQQLLSNECDAATSLLLCATEQLQSSSSST